MTSPDSLSRQSRRPDALDAAHVRLGIEPSPHVYRRDYCNACGAACGNRHQDHCHLTGEVVRWSGIPVLKEGS